MQLRVNGVKKMLQDRVGNEQAVTGQAYIAVSDADKALPMQQMDELLVVLHEVSSGHFAVCFDSKTPCGA